MTYPWQTNIWPIPAGTEIKASHFDDLRRNVYLHRFHLAGCEGSQYNYNDPITNSTWSAWCTSLFSDPANFTQGDGMDYRRANWENLINIVFRSSANEQADLYTVYNTYAFTSLQDIINNPPVFSNGTLNSAKWCYAVDISRYHDFDRYSGRRIVKTYTAGSLDTFLSSVEGWRYLPIQVGRDYQRKHIKYTNTEREIISKKERGLDWHDITQPSTLGPNFDIEGVFSSGNYRRRKIPLSGDADFLPLVGEQYAIIMPYTDPPQNDGEGGAADAVPGDGPGENQHGCDPKLCDAYQNQIEQIISAGYWMIPIQAGTPWGDAFIKNWNESLWSNTPNWPDYLFDGTGDTTRHNNGVWHGYHSNGTPSTENGWTRLDYGHDNKDTEPTYATMDSEFWGCNKSSLELALWMIDSYDYYYDSSHIFTPDNLLQIRAQEFNLSPPTSEEDVNAMYPLSHRTIRRTHRYTFGRPKNNMTMMPGSMTLPVYEPYSSYQDGGSPLWFSGSFIPANEVPSAESEYLTEAQISEIRERHEAVFRDGTTRYEQMRKMLNDLWSLLAACSWVYSNIYVGLEMRGGTGTSDSNNDTTNEAYQEAVALAEAATESANYGLCVNGQHAAIGGDFNFHGVPGSGGYDWSAAGTRFESRIVIEKSDITERTDHVQVFILIKPEFINGMYGPPSFKNTVHSMTVTIGDVEIEIPNWDQNTFGSPPVPPASWYEWGGMDPNIYYAVKGKMIAATIPLDEEYLEEDGFYHVPIIFTNSYPSSIENATGNPDNSGFVLSRCDMLLSEVLPGLAYVIDMDGNGIDWNTKSYRTFTEIAVDDELFNAAGDVV
jgi:hypothetical protein